MKYDTLKAIVNAKVYENTEQEITGEGLNEVLQSAIASLGAHYQMGGLVSPTDHITVGDEPVVFIATTPGTYTNFGGLVVADGEVALLVWSGTAWGKQTPDIATRTEVSQLGQKVNDIDYTSSLSAGYAISVGSYSIGDTVDTTPSSNPSISCLLLQVKKNAIIKLTGKGASGPRLWAILDSSKKLLSMADASVTVTDLKISIAQDGYLVVNVYTANTKSIILLCQYVTVADYQQFKSTVESTFDSYAKNGSFFDSDYKFYISKTDGKLTDDGGGATVKCTTHYLPVKAGLKIYGCTGTRQTLIAFYDAGLNFLSAHTTATQGVNTLVTLAAGDIPSGAKYFRSSGFDGAYIEGLTDDDLIKASAEVARTLVSDVGFNPLSLNFRDRYTINTNANVGETVNLTYTFNENYASSVTAVKAGDIVHFCGLGSNSYRVAALTDKTLKLLYKSGVGPFFAETLYVTQDGFLIINYSKSYDYLFYVECADKNILPFKRARWIAMGDSITQGYYSDNNGSDVNTQKCWAHLVSAIKRNIFYNAGVGWQGYKHEVTSGNATDLVQTIDFSDYDLVTLMYGINDYKGGDSLGSMDDVVADKGSVIACLRFVIETIIASNPLIKIVLITPLNARGYEGARLGDETTNYAIGYEVNGKTLEDFFDAFVEVCKYYGIQYVDMTHASIVNRKNIATALPDGVHPALDTHLMLARELSQKITVY